MSGDVRVDLGQVNAAIASAIQQVDVVDGRLVPGALKGRDRSAELGAISKDLLHLAHLCDKARVLVMDEYHRTRGFTATPEGRSA